MRPCALLFVSGLGWFGCSPTGVDSQSVATQSTASAPTLNALRHRRLGAGLAVSSGGTLAASTDVLGAFDSTVSSPHSPLPPVGTCKIDTEVPSPSDSGSHLSAGTLTLTGTTSVAITPSATDAYEQSVARSLWTREGTWVSLHASGAEVPAFTTWLEAPGSIAITAPAPTNGSLTIDRAQDLVLQWPGSATVGEVIFLIGGQLGTTSAPVVICRFDPARGEGVVPRSVLSGLGAGPAVVLAGVSHSEDRLIAKWHLNFHLDIGATLADGTTGYALPATLQ